MLLWKKQNYHIWLKWNCPVCHAESAVNVSCCVPLSEIRVSVFFLQGFTINNMSTYDDSKSSDVLKDTLRC